MPGSTLPLSGNSNNVINVGDGGFPGIGRWPNLGLPYHVTEESGTLPGGQLAIDPDVTVEFAPDGWLVIRSTRRVIADGLPGAPITFRAIDPNQGWTGIVYNVNDTEGPRLEYCSIQDADFGVIATDSTAYVQNCIFQSNAVGTNTNTFGNLYIDKTHFLGNATGVSHTDLGGITLFSPTNPNSFDDNGVAMNAFEPGSSADAQMCGGETRRDRSILKTPVGKAMQSLVPAPTT